MARSSSGGADELPAATEARPRPIARLSSGLSFLSGGVFAGSYYGQRRPLSTAARRQTSIHYQTFPVAPPKTPSAAASATASDSRSDGSEASETGEQAGDGFNSAALPWRQLILLAFLSLAEQTALNSIAPYLPTMVSTFPSVPPQSIGLYVGLLASAFALAQLTTNLAWGYASDALGRKPILLIGAGCLAGCFAAFGFVQDFPAAVAVHALMGALNGNAAVVPTCLGDMTTRATQGTAFAWLPIVYSIGGITGPALGGLLAGKEGENKWPFLVSNLCASAALAVAVAVLGVWFDETLDDANRKAGTAEIASSLKSWGCIWWCCHRKRGRSKNINSRSSTPEQAGLADTENAASGEDVDEQVERDTRRMTPDSHGGHTLSHQDTNGDDDMDRKPLSSLRPLLNRTTATVLATYLFFQLSNVSFNSLYPIFASSPPPTGRNLGPGTIGVSLSIAGVLTIAFQVLAYSSLQSRLGNLGTYRLAFLGLAISMALMPWVGYLRRDQAVLGVTLHGNLDLDDWPVYLELGVVLVLKNICAVVGLSSAFLLITNSAPSQETLGTLNGIAQTLSAGGRTVGPFFSGGLFALSTRVRPKGELLAWWLFGGIAVVGWIVSLAIRGYGLESEDVGADANDEDETDEEGLVS